MDELSISKTVRRVDTGYENDCFTLAIAENADGSGWHLLIMIGDEFDEQDVALGMHTHCLTNADNDTVYGGIASCELDETVLRVALTPNAAEILDLPAQVDIELALTQDDLATLESGLRRVGVLT